jgi:hypothetical protein
LCRSDHERGRLQLELQLLMMKVPQQTPSPWLEVRAEELLMQFLPWELMFKVAWVEVIVEQLLLLQEVQ